MAFQTYGQHHMPQSQNNTYDSEGKERIVKQKIIGQKHDDSFLHVTDFEIYNKLLKQKITY